MNEQLVVKNFGPIKDATVDFKRVTVFIGPTGGGKSTLAKLAAIFRDDEFYRPGETPPIKLFAYKATKYELAGEIYEGTSIEWIGDRRSVVIENSAFDVQAPVNELGVSPLEFIEQLGQAANADINAVLREKVRNNEDISGTLQQFYSAHKNLFDDFVSHAREIVYIPAERVFLVSVLGGLAGLLTAKVALPEHLLDFGRAFEQARRIEKRYDLPLFGAQYSFEDGVDKIKVGESVEIKLSKAASGIQSSLPMLLVLNASSAAPGPDSFIVEEPELNLFPLAQLELVKLLLSYSKAPDTDLIITTHSPYVLTALNLMCYAFRIAQQDEATAKKVAKIIPRHCWIDPEQFAAYYVDRPDTKRKQQVRSIINKKTGLIEENELDTASEELSNIFDKLLDLRQPVKSTARAN